MNYLEGEWRDKRNQLMHALFNKNPEAMYSELLLLVEQGYQAARQLDNAVRFVKRAKIREYNKMGSIGEYYFRELRISEQ